MLFSFMCFYKKSHLFEGSDHVVLFKVDLFRDVDRFRGVIEQPPDPGIYQNVCNRLRHFTRDRNDADLDLFFLYNARYVVDMKTVDAVELPAYLVGVNIKNGNDRQLGAFPAEVVGDGPAQVPDAGNAYVDALVAVDDLPDQVDQFLYIVSIAQGSRIPDQHYVAPDLYCSDMLYDCYFV